MMEEKELIILCLFTIVLYIMQYYSYYPLAIADSYVGS